MEKRLALRVPQLRTWTLSHPTGADKLHRAFHGIDGRAIVSFSGAQVRPSVVCSRFREAIRVSLLSFRGGSEAQSRNLLMRPTSVTPFACGEINIAARNRRV